MLKLINIVYWITPHTQRKITLINNQNALNLYAMIIQKNIPIYILLFIQQKNMMS
jgi:hypothetical protein